MQLSDTEIYSDWGANSVRTLKNGAKCTRTLFGTENIVPIDVRFKDEQLNQVM